MVATIAGAAPASAMEGYQPIPGLSAKDRAILAANMVQQGQCRNGLVEIREAMKELPEDETLLRLKGFCEMDMVQEARNRRSCSG